MAGGSGVVAPGQGTIPSERDDGLLGGGVTRGRFGRPAAAADSAPAASHDDQPAARHDDLLSSDGALIAGPDVANSPRDSTRRWLLAGADVAGVAVAYLGVWLLVPPAGTIADRLALLAALPLWVLLNKLLGLYDRDDKVIHKSTLDELPKILQSLTMGTLLVFALGDLVMPVETARVPAFAFWCLALVTVPVLRATARSTARRWYPPERCLLVGSGSVANTIARKLASHAEYGTDLLGYVDAEGPEGSRMPAPDGLPRLGDMAEFGEICRSLEVERVVVAFSTLSNDRMLDIIRSAKRNRIKITIVPRLYEVIGHSVVVDEVEGMTVLTLRGLTRSRSSLLLKRWIDVTLSAAGLILMLPVLTAIAAAIKLTSPGPILFTQRRMGRDRPFTLLKFRTMVSDADARKEELAHLNEAVAPMFKIKDDPRVTRVGRFLRARSLDELPQLWNVLRGEMSLVGPRPLVLDEDSHVLGWHRTRLDLTPGLTGPWQVAGRAFVPFEEMVKMDYLYVAEWSLWKDARLLLRTAPIVVLGRGH